MRVRDRGFALMLVLIAAAGAFALATQAGLTLRASLTEARSAIDRAESNRRARGAVVIALNGLLTPATGFEEGASARDSASVFSGSNTQPATEIDPGDELELPAIVRELLGGSLAQVEEEQQDREDRAEDRAGRNGGLGAETVIAGPDRRTGIGLRQLERFGLPALPIEFQVPEDDAVYTVEFADAVGLLDLNVAEEAQLTTYLRLVGVETGRASAIAHQILDWRDEDDFVRPLGAERANYEGSGVEIANDRFAAVEQLLYLPSMTRDIYARIRRDIILEGTGVHANSAPFEVLASVPGMSRSFAQRILEARASRPLSDQTLKQIAPPGSDLALANLRAKPTGLVRIRLTMRDEGVRTFEGYAALDDRGVRAITLAPVYDLPEGEL